MRRPPAPNPFANLRAFCEWWRDDRHYYACCEAATEEELETEPELFDCESCPVAAARAALWPENAELWTLYGQIVNRFLVDTGSMSLSIAAACDGLDPAETLDRLQRFGLIYDVLQPPPKKKR